MTVTYRSFASSVVSNTNWVETNVLGYNTANYARISAVAGGALGSTNTTTDGTLVVDFDLPDLVDPTGLQVTCVTSVTMTHTGGQATYSVEASVNGGVDWTVLFSYDGNAHGSIVWPIEVSDIIPVGMVASDVQVRIVATMQSGTGSTSTRADLHCRWVFVQVADAGVSHTYPDPSNYPLGLGASAANIISYGHSWMGGAGYQTAGNHFIEQLATHYGGTAFPRNVNGTTSVEMASRIRDATNGWDLTRATDGTIGIDEGPVVISSALNDNLYTADLRVETVADQIRASLAAFRASWRHPHTDTSNAMFWFNRQAFFTYTGTWSSGSSGGMNGFHTSTDATATATFTFDKSEEVCVVLNGWATGIGGLAPVDIYLDDVFQETIDTESYFVNAQYQTSPQTHCVIPLIYRNLSYGVHTVRIEHAGVGGDAISIEGAYVTSPSDVARTPVVVLFEGYPSDAAYLSWDNDAVTPSRTTYDNYFSYVQDAINDMGGKNNNIWLLDMRSTIDFQVNPSFFGGDELHLTDAGHDEVYSYLLDGPPVLRYGVGYTGGYSTINNPTGTIQSSLPSFSQNAAGSTVKPSDTGTTQSILPSLEQGAVGNTSVPASTGTINNTLSALEQLSSGDTTQPVDLGVINSTFPSITQTATGSATAPADPSTLTVVQQGNDVVLEWSAPTMSGATHVAIFRREGTSEEPFDPQVDVEIDRVPIGTGQYIDNDVPLGDYAYQVFPVGA